MQLVTASDTAHLRSASSTAVGLSCAQKAAIADLAIPSLTESDGKSSFISFSTSAQKSTLVFISIPFFSF
jgi:hypothetical protein